MCHFTGAQTDWRERLREAADDDEPPAVDIAEPEIGDHEIEEPELDEPEIGQAELD